jgi:hypothetical protein
MESTGAVTRSQPLTRAALGLAAATVVAWIVLAALDHDGAGWLLLPILGVATAVTAWRAGGTSPKNRGAFAAFIIGVLAILVFVAFVIADAVS